MMKKVLYVEDDEINAMLFNKILGGDFEITIAKSGKEALSLVASHAYDVLLIDYNLKHEDGLSLLQNIRSFHNEHYCPAIALTADIHILEDLISQGFDAALSKPFIKKEILHAVKNLTVRHQD